MAKTYFTKCGITFQKSSTAVVTRFEEINDKCKDCPYIEHGSTYRGGQEVPITYCQAGSKKPNHKNEYSTTCETDATTLSIISLDMAFLKTVYEFATSQPGYLGSTKWSKVFHGLDKEDCRKSMPLYFENNKKGKAVKKAIIEKYFSDSKSFEKHTPGDGPADEVSVKMLPTEMKYKARCPYLSVIGDKYIRCSLHAMHRGSPEFPSHGALAEHIKSICYCDFDKCDIYQSTYNEEMESTEKYILECRECGFCCNNSHYTGLKEHDGSTHGFCQLWQDDKELFNTSTVCEWFNKRYRPQESKMGKLKENVHPDWPNQNCIDCESCIDRQCSQGVFKNTRMVEISDGTKACPRFKQKAIPECPYYGGHSPDGRKYKIKCGDNHYLMFEDKEKLQEHIEYCKTSYKSCRAYTRCELKRLGIDLGPASPQKTEHLIDLLQTAVSKAADCTNCKNLGVYDYDGYNAEEGIFVWSCKLNLMKAGSNCVCKNYERSPLIEVCDSETEGMEVYFNGSECSKDCHNKRDGKCTVTSVSGSALKFFALDEKAPVCENMTALKVRYLKELKHCSHAHTGCTAAINTCSLKGEYCCYTCKQPCNLYCSFAKELVPYGLLRDDDKGLVQVSPTELAYIYSMEMDTADGQAAALNSHLQYIQKKSEDIVGNYVEIGFVIINIRDNELYKARGYSNHIECVEAELNMKKSTAYNLIKIAEKFGAPETKRLKAEYSQYNYVQCLEMSTMTKEELALTSPDMSKREMQELKKSNRLEKTKDEYTEQSKATVPPGNGLAQLIEGTGSSVIDVTEYKVCDNGNKDNQEQPGPVHPEEGTAAHGQDDNNLSSHRKVPFYIRDADPEENPQPETGTDQKTITEEQPQPGAADKNDYLINKLLLENDEYKQTVDALQHDKDTLRELVSEIDSKFDRLSKKQIRNALWDFITTGMILFEEE